MKVYKVIFFCALLLLLSTTIASANSNTNTSDYSYSLLTDSTAKITSYFGKSLDITIPTEIDGFSVTTIDSLAFYDCVPIRTITIPNSVISIEDNPFNYCTNLSQIYVSGDHPVFSTVDSVLFHKTENRLICYPRGKMKDSYSIPVGITEIGNYAFSNSHYLNEVIIPNSVTVIGDYAFSNCYELSHAALPGHLSHIGEHAFYECFSLELTSIPGSVEEIGYSAFQNCDSLVSIVIGDGVKMLGNYSFSYCDSLVSVTIPDSVTGAGDFVFYDSDRLSNVYAGKDSYAMESLMIAAEVFSSSTDWLFE